MAISKQSRQFTIRQIISHEAISNQDDLVRALGRAGIDVTQATLSRDLAEMGVARVSTSDGPKYVLGPEGEDRRIRALLSYEVTSIDHNESLIVVKTLTGRAQGVAELVDSLKHPAILATLAGDNTILVVPRSVAAIGELVGTLREFITTSE
jgi:transcriptional regulator of arginine metabolism